MSHFFRARARTSWPAAALLWLVIPSACAAPKAGATPAAAAPAPRVTAPPTPAQAPADFDAGMLPPLEGVQAPELAPVSTKATRKTDPAWASCGSKLISKGVDPAREVAALATACAGTSRMKPVGKPILGRQSDAEAPQAYPLQAEAKHCYRVYARGESRIEILDVAIVDSMGLSAGQASTHGLTAVVLEDSAVCFEQSDSASVVVSVGRGGGAYALQVWGD